MTKGHITIINSTTQEKKTSVYRRYLFCTLVLLELLMSSSFLGYIHVPPISITVAYLPILIAAIALGIPQAIALGVIFGLSSAYKASVYYISEADMVFSPMLSMSPLNSIILAVGSRIFFAMIIGTLCHYALKTRFKIALCALIGLLTPKLQALCVYTTLETLFPALGFTKVNALYLNIDEILRAATCAAFAVLTAVLRYNSAIKKIAKAIDKYQGDEHNYYSIKVMVIAVIFVVTIIMICSVFYITQSLEFMLTQYNVSITDTLSNDLLNVQAQFMITCLSLCLILVIFLITGYRYMAYNGYVGQLDALTNVLGRRIFFDTCAKLEHERATVHKDEPWFMIFDVDLFKQINDSYGHVSGDRVLHHVASVLLSTFEKHGFVGRIGGDEFAVVISNQLSSFIMQDMDRLYRMLNEPPILPDIKISLSAGICHFDSWHDPQTMMSKADSLLYRAKKNGRSGYVIGKDDGEILHEKHYQLKNNGEKTATHNAEKQKTA